MVFIVKKDKHKQLTQSAWDHLFKTSSEIEGEASFEKKSNIFILKRILFTYSTDYPGN